jgi:hypothetical protein
MASLTRWNDQTERVGIVLGTIYSSAGWEDSRWFRDFQATRHVIARGISPAAPRDVAMHPRSRSFRMAELFWLNIEFVGLKDSNGENRLVREP